MEDSIAIHKRPRPALQYDPNTPMRSNMTPNQQTNIATQQPRPTATPGPREISGGGSLLQERIRERKVESARQDRRRSVDMTGGTTPQIQSSPINGSRRRDERRPSSSGIATSKEMGVKQIADQVSTLHKQNFDLKLEVHHRRERQKVLEARLVAAEKQIEEMAQLQEINEQLVAELEKRDQAVEEAVGIIVSLEDQVYQLKHNNSTNSDEQREQAYFEGGHDGLPSSPPQFEETPAKATELHPRQRALARMPSFLSENSEGAEALRSLYLPLHHRNSELNLPKLSEETTDGMNSPRLSVLSESSFLSIYGDWNFKLDDSGDQQEEPSSGRHRASSSVEKWVESRPAAVTPSPTSRKGCANNSQFLSINSILDSPLQRLERLTIKFEKQEEKSRQRLDRASSTRDKSRPFEPLRRVRGNSSFENHHPLPPTPDTISTSTLRHYQNSTDTLGHDAKRGTIVGNAHNPVPITNYNSLQTTVPLRPRSACETVTSRREGHGWDTETQDDYAESSTASLDCPPPRRGPDRVRTPNLFMFGNDADDDRDWGRDIMFGSGLAYPSGTSRNANTYNDEVRLASLVEPSCNESTAQPSCNTLARYNPAPGPSNSATTPTLPDRRSSLSATTKLRKSTGTGSSGGQGDPNPAPTPHTTNQDSGKKPRLLSGRFFGRSETSPIVATVPTRHTPNAPADRNQNRFGRREEIDDREYATATPPPIKRSRTVQGGYRPASAGTGIASASRGIDSFYRHDGAGVGGERAAQVETPGATESAKSGSRKWFGRGNLRRN